MICLSPAQFRGVINFYGYAGQQLSLIDSLREALTYPIQRRTYDVFVEIIWQSMIFWD